MVHSCAAIAQLGERQTEDLKVTGSIPVRGGTTCRSVILSTILFRYTRVFKVVWWQLLPAMSVSVYPYTTIRRVICND
eukprot:SAG11_NODE_662_length_7875_cov_17.557613_8_plen_78_part_00